VPPKPKLPPHDVADLGLAEDGAARIGWAASRMPVLARIGERFAAERPLDGIGVALCLHVTAETGVLARTLTAGGADVALAAANPLSTQDEVAAALVAEGIAVHAVHGEDLDRYAAHLVALADGEPRIVLDDGADLVGLLHDARPQTAERMLGATEETTTGLVRLRQMEVDGRLRCPVIAVNESRTERAFNDRYGTGQSTLDGIVRATNVLLAGAVVVVLGYGWTGKGVAQRARGLGAHVIVCEVDPIRALEARMEGLEVLPALEAVARGDVLITVTGGRGVLGAPHFERMKDGAILANAGHFDVEIDLGALADLASGRREVRPLIEEFDLGGRRLNLLAHGRVVNLAAAEGHPAAVMDLSFATQALAAEDLVRGGAPEPRVHPYPEHLDREVARLKLDALGVEIDALTAEQAVYRTAWSPAPHDG
jgi:adenosylhomocysteinase